MGFLAAYCFFVRAHFLGFAYCPLTDYGGYGRMGSRGLMMSDTRRFGVLRISSTLLRDVLHLPSDTTFYQLGDLLELREADIFEFLISHPGLPICPPGGVLRDSVLPMK